MSYDVIYGSEEDLHLPHSARTYFDPICHEYQTYPMENKLLDIGYLTWHGYDIRQDIYTCFQKHEHVLVDDVMRGVKELAAAACRVNPYASGIMQRRNSLDTEIDLMLEDIMSRYRLPVDDEKTHYMAESGKEMRLGELLGMNGWRIARNEIEAYKMYNEDNAIYYPGDSWPVRRHNLEVYEQKQGVAQSVFYSYVCPEPWYGDPLKAKVIILGGVPLYDNFICRSQNIFNGHFPQLMEEVQITVRNWMKFGGYEIYREAYSFGTYCVPNMDGYNSTAYRHWIHEITRLANYTDAVHQTFFDNIAVVNATPYYSNGDDPLAAGLLPSHYFLRQLIRFIAVNNSKVLFVIPSKELDRAWRKILADAYAIIRSIGQSIVIDKLNPELSLSDYVIGSHNQMRIFDAIYEDLE